MAPEQVSEKNKHLEQDKTKCLQQSFYVMHTHRRTLRASLSNITYFVCELIIFNGCK